MIKKDQVVSMTYTLTDGKGTVLDQSGDEPLEYLHGHGNIIPGLEKALDGMQVGDKKKVDVPAAQGYGAYDPELRFEVERSAFGKQAPEPGMTVQLQGGGRQMIARVLQVGDEKVLLDANHPMAGQDLSFDVEITGTRAATAEEISHGHVHGPHGHHHH